MHSHLAASSFAAAFSACLLVACATPAPSDGSESAEQRLASTSSCTVQLTAKALGSLSSAKDDFNATCPSGYEWCSIGTIEAYDASGCAAMTIREVVAAVERAGAGAYPWHGARAVAYLDSEGLAAAPFFSRYDPTLLQEIDAWAGSTASLGYEASDELRCHNCHETAYGYVVFYPETGVVVVIAGKSGYDS